ncbi:HalOD1 output domain-containing protein [Halovivax limisalsi]|uniref:HalOD1 output domain-containing protein n=1 Tax=Halovivax limisalsi TaxID=1453760 RepID=UPI001FFD58B7|nr:HalOD1 output domain-containing protein [Halovivax limisalsi]
MSRTDDGDDRVRIEEQAPATQGGRDAFHTIVDVGGTNDPVVTELVSAVAAVTGTNVTRLEPITKTVDPDALERFVAHWQRGSRNRPPATLAFEYEGCTIEVRADGRLTVDATDWLEGERV